MDRYTLARKAQYLKDKIDAYYKYTIDNDNPIENTNKRYKKFNKQINEALEIFK